MKKIFVGLLVGNLVHFGAREAGSLMKAYRSRECKHAKSSEMCRDASLAEKVLTFELDLGSKVFTD